MSLVASYYKAANNLTAAGLLVGQNLGTISNVIVQGEIFDPGMNDPDGFGIVVGSNSGSISKARAYGRIIAYNNMGGLAYENVSGGSINQSVARTDLFQESATPTVADVTGGLVAIQSGSSSEINQSVSHANYFSNGRGDTTGGGAFGGLVAVMSGGSIEQSYVSRFSEFQMSDFTYTASNIGGLVGEVTGSAIIDESYTLGAMELASGFTLGTNHRAIVGSDGGASLSSVLYAHQPMTNENSGSTTTSDFTATGCTSGTLSLTITSGLNGHSFTTDSIVRLKRLVRSGAPNLFGKTDYSIFTGTPFTTGTGAETIDLDECPVLGTGNMNKIVFFSQSGATEVAGAQYYTMRDFSDETTFSVEGWSYLDEDSTALDMYHYYILTGINLGVSSAAWEFNDNLGGPTLLETEFPGRDLL